MNTLYVLGMFATLAVPQCTGVAWVTLTVVWGLATAWQEER